MISLPHLCSARKSRGWRFDLQSNMSRCMNRNSIPRWIVRGHTGPLRRRRTRNECSLWETFFSPLGLLLNPLLSPRRLLLILLICCLHSLLCSYRPHHPLSIRLCILPGGLLRRNTMRFPPLLLPSSSASFSFLLRRWGNRCHRLCALLIFLLDFLRLLLSSFRCVLFLTAADILGELGLLLLHPLI